MDLTRPVSYRSLQLNDSGSTGGGPITGIQLDSVDYSDVPGVGYSEKRSMDDGFDSSDVFLGARRVQLQGTVYGASRANLYDRLQDLRYAFSPTAAYASDPGDFGYLPLNFDVPTNDNRWPAEASGLRFIPQALRVRPSRLPQWSVVRDRTGGVDTGMAMQFMVQCDAKDPRVYAQTEQDHSSWVGRTVNPTPAPSMLNRGDYPSPLNILLAAPAGAAAATLDIVIGSSNMHLKMPASASAQVLRYDGTKKVVTLQVGSVVSLRMDLLSFTAGTTHPLIIPGANSFTYSRGVAIGAGSHMWFWESWA